LRNYVNHYSEGTNDHQEVYEKQSQVLENCRKHFNEETQFGKDPYKKTEFEEAAYRDCHLQSLNCLKLGRVSEGEHEIG